VFKPIRTRLASALCRFQRFNLHIGKPHLSSFRLQEYPDTLHGNKPARIAGIELFDIGEAIHYSAIEKMR
jgi:hypothetical protein